MKFRSLKNWKNPKKLEGLAYFCQLLEELLFDYSLDTYKPSAMNTSALCIEALNLTKEIESELIDKSNLTHVLKELTFNLKKDEIAISLLDIEVDTICAKLHDINCTLQENKIFLELMVSQLKYDLYKAKAELLLNEAVQNSKEKNRIRALTRNYVTTLINMGYSPRFLYPNVRRVFHWKVNEISKTEDIKLFFSLVTGEDLEYVAIFKAGKVFDEIKDSCKELDIKIVDVLEGDYLTYATSKNFTLGEDKRYLIVEELHEKDVFSARNEAEKSIEIISTLTNLFHHNLFKNKETALWESNALVVNIKTNTSRLINAPKNPMLMCADHAAEVAAKKLNKFLNDFSLHDQDSFVKFFRATELHSLALRNDSPENQLLNLWVALESLVPSRTSKSKAKINNIIDSTLPILTLQYIYLLTSRLVTDFKVWNIAIFKKYVGKVEGGDDREKLLNLLFLKKHAKDKDKLFNELGEFYLLRNRAHYFVECLSSTKKIEKLLNTHWQRVDWQLRRIYRTRNQIVHAGYTPSYIDILIKNLHDYLDNVTNSIVTLASEGDKINTVEQAFKYAEIKFNEYMALLKNKESYIDEANIKNLLFDKFV